MDCNIPYAWMEFSRQRISAGLKSLYIDSGGPQATAGPRILADFRPAGFRGHERQPQTAQVTG